MTSEGAGAQDTNNHSASEHRKSQLRAFVRTKMGAVVSITVITIIALTIWMIVEQGIQNATEHRNGPEYQTVIPKGKTITDLGGWKRISPPKASPVYAYSDTLDNISISVSQQPLPSSFNGDVAELAKKFNATDQVDANGTKIYIGTSAKGPQSAIFSKNGLLVLIKSQKNIDDKAWAYYVESLIGTDPSLTNF